MTSFEFERTFVLGTTFSHLYVTVLIDEEIYKTLQKALQLAAYVNWNSYKILCT